MSQTLAVTSTTAVRDNDYGFFQNVTKSIVKSNKNILRVQIFDANGTLMGSSNEEQVSKAFDGRSPAEGAGTAFFNNQPVFEFQEQLDYGSQVGNGLIVISYSQDGPAGADHGCWRTARAEALRKTLVISLGLGLGFMVLAGVLVAIQSHRVTRPLGVLTQQGDAAGRR